MAYWYISSVGLDGIESNIHFIDFKSIFDEPSSSALDDNNRSDN